MAIVTITNDTCTAQVDTMGAQLLSMRFDDREYLWQRDERWWGRTSPILFPIVGNIRNGEAEMNDARCRELCKVAIQVLETGHGESYRFTLNKQRVLEVNGKNEHFINNKLLYSFNNE